MSHLCDYLQNYCKKGLINNIFGSGFNIIVCAKRQNNSATQLYEFTNSIGSLLQNSFNSVENNEDNEI